MSETVILHVGDRPTSVVLLSRCLTRSTVLDEEDVVLPVEVVRDLVDLV